MVRALAVSGGLVLCSALGGCNSKPSQQAEESGAKAYEAVGAFDDALKRGQRNGGTCRPPARPAVARKRQGVLGKRETLDLHLAVRKAVNHEVIRWVHPGNVVTEDFAPERLNVMVNENGLVVSARCG
jgi:hypothetical protein